MKIKILGTRGEISESAPYHSKQSGILLDGKLMLDLGEEEFLQYEPANIIFTHLHPDHAFFVRDPENAPEIDARMYGPEPYHRGPVKVIKYTGAGKIGGYHIRTVPTIHSQKVKSQGIIVSRHEKKILYTGDLIWIKRWYHRYFRDLDLVITEASFIRRSGMVRRERRRGNIYGHAGIGRLISTFSKCTGHIVLTHFGTWLYKDIKEARKRIREIAGREGVEVTVGYDGLEIKI